MFKTKRGEYIDEHNKDRIKKDSVVDISLQGREEREPKKLGRGLSYILWCYVVHSDTSGKPSHRGSWVCFPACNTWGHKVHASKPAT